MIINKEYCKVTIFCRIPIGEKFETLYSILLDPNKCYIKKDDVRALDIKSNKLINFPNEEIVYIYEKE